MEEIGYPTDLKSCGSDNASVNPEAYTKDMQKVVNEKIKKISKLIDSSDLKIKSSTDVQGIFTIITHFAILLQWCVIRNLLLTTETSVQTG